MLMFLFKDCMYFDLFYVFLLELVQHNEKKLVPNLVI